VRIAHRDTLSGSSVDDLLNEDPEKERLSPGTGTKSTSLRNRGESITISSGSTSARTKMYMMLQDERVFDEFMSVLLKEHCAECMLSVIEFTQFRDQIKEMIQKAESFVRTSSDTGEFTLPYTDTFPLSGIVFGPNTADEGNDKIEDHDSNEYGAIAETDEIDSPSYTLVDYKKIARKLWDNISG